MNTKLKEEAIGLRKKGLTYSEIRQIIPCAKSTLSDWLHSVGLAKYQKQRITLKRLAASKRGWEARRKNRITMTEQIKNLAHQDIQTVSQKELWLIGIMLYWAEGSKEKSGRGSRVCFSNQDPLMIKIFIKWLKVCLKIIPEEISLDIYIHENHKYDLEGVRNYWSKITGFYASKFDKIYFKKHKIKTNRTNIGNNYHGLVRVQVRKSIYLNRKITGWIEKICYICGVV